MTKKALLLLNPQAGKNTMKHHLLGIVDLFVKEGWNVTVYPTQFPRDAVNAARTMAEEYDMLLVSGGDGTLSEVVTGLMSCEKRPAIGYLPSGTTNDFARTLGLPKKAERGAKLILTEPPMPIDVGSFGGDYFVYIASFGAFTEVSYKTPRRLKKVFGHLAYILESIKSFGSIRSYHLKIVYDGRTIEGDYIFGMVTNSTSVGGFHFKKQAQFDVKLDDGRFELALIKSPQNAWETQQIINDLLRQKLDSPYFEIYKVSRMKVVSQQEIPWTLDGEYGGSVKEVEIQNHFQAVKIYGDSPGWLHRKLQEMAEDSRTGRTAE